MTSCNTNDSNNTPKPTATTTHELFSVIQAATAVPTMVMPIYTLVPTVTSVLPATATITPVPVATSTVNAQLIGDEGTYVRSMPGTMGQIDRIVNGAAPLTIVGRTADSIWLQVVFDGGVGGWVHSDDMIINIDLNGIEISGIAEEAIIEGTVKMDAGGLRMRERPDSNSAVITNLDALQSLNIEGRLSDNSWIRVVTSGGHEGWVATEYIDIKNATEEIPIVEADTVTVATTFDAEVIAEGDGLRVRSRASLNGELIIKLPSFSQLHIVGRTADNTWLEIVTTDGYRGWVWTNYLRVRIDLSNIAVTGEAEVVELLQPPPEGYTIRPGGQRIGLISGISSHSREIFIRGQSLGNRANVFSKVGDSLTDTPYMFGPIGWNAYELGEFGYLQTVVHYFQNANAREGNSFVNPSMAAYGGWTTEMVLDAQYADQSICRAGEIPLECEYRVTKPSIVLIMLGTNDITFMGGDIYRANLSRIVEISIERGVIPVLSTLPVRRDAENVDTTFFNNIIHEVSMAYDVPLWDFWAASKDLPNNGLANDNLHLSFPPPGDYSLAANFNVENLDYGYTIRNLTALQVLDAIWRQVLSG